MDRRIKNSKSEKDEKLLKLEVYLYRIIQMIICIFTKRETVPLKEILLLKKTQILTSSFSG